MRVSLILISMLAFSCTSEKGPLLENVCVTGSDTITYTSHIKTFIDGSCAVAGCHDAGSLNGDLTTYQNVRLKVDDGTIRNRVLILHDMPPSPTPGLLPTRCDLQRLEKWLNDGAPE